MYSETKFWKGLVMVINCNELRQESSRCNSRQEITSSSSSVTSSDLSITTHHNQVTPQDPHRKTMKSTPSASSSGASAQELSSVENVRSNLYLSIEMRGFDAICLMGASDTDIIDFASKISPTVMRKINWASLKSSSLSDKGLEIFLAALNQSLVRLELSG